jgi:hypothetical protein
MKSAICFIAMRVEAICEAFGRRDRMRLETR